VVASGQPSGCPPATKEVDVSHRCLQVFIEPDAIAERVDDLHAFCVVEGNADKGESNRALFFRYLWQSAPAASLWLPCPSLDKIICQRTTRLVGE
jgi:hypothetical protein